MSELYREIQDDIRQERLEKLWHSFGKLMIGASVIVILATIIVVVMQNRKQERAMQMTSRFIQGVDRLNIEDYKSAIALFTELASDPASPYYGLAMLRKAQAENALSQKDLAAKTYESLAAHDPVFGSLGAMLRSDADTPLLPPTLGAPFYYTQSELRGWQLLQQNKKDEGVAQLVVLHNDNSTPPSLHGRVNEALRYLAPDSLRKPSNEAQASKDPSHD